MCFKALTDVATVALMKWSFMDQAWWRWVWVWVPIASRWGIMQQCFCSGD